MRRFMLTLITAALVAGCMHPSGVPIAIVRTPADRRAAFTEAIQLVKNERYAEAARRFGDLETTYPVLADYHLYYRGVALARSGHPAEAIAALQRVLLEYPRSVLRAPAALELGRAQRQLGQLDAARDTLRRAAESPDRAIAPAAELELAGVDLAAGDIAAAARRLQHIRRAAPRQPAGIEARADLLRLRATYPAIAPAGSEQIEEVRVLLAEQDAGAAESLARRLLAHAGDADRETLLRLHASALLSLERIDDALTDLRTLARSEVDASATQFRIASILWNHDRDTEALAAFAELRRRFPNTPKATEALYALGRIYEKAGRTQQALSAYRQLAATRNQFAREAQWRIGWIHYTNDDWRAAAESFRVLADGRSADNCADALYWQARALERQGDAAAAQERYRRIISEAPSNYYAMWAEHRLRRPALAPVKVDLPAPPALPTAATDEHLQRAVELQLAGFPPFARTELAAYEQEHAGNPAELRPLLQWYRAVDGDGAALRLAQRLGENAGLGPVERERVLYPLGFWPIIQDATRGASLDPLLVAAVIRQESLYDPDARSPADAYGLMQLLPRTAQRLAGERVSIDELRDPHRNIALGTRYLAQLLRQFGGDQLKAIAAYNGGETAVEKWQRRSDGREDDEFVELISYRETRDYVKKVIGGYRRYRGLYAASN